MASQIPHIVCLPAPAQGHINPMIKLAKLIHSKGFYITFVLTEFDLARVIENSAIKSSFFEGLPDFRVETIPDGLPMDNKHSLHDLPELCENLLDGEAKKAFKEVLGRLNASPDIPLITCVIADGVMCFVPDVTIELGIPLLNFYTTSACGMLAYMQYDDLLKRGYFPLKDESYLTNGYLDTPTDWVPGLIKGTKLKHFPTFIRTTNPNDTMFNYLAKAARNSVLAEGMILNTFDDLEAEGLKEIKNKVPNLFTIGPLTLLCKQLNGQEILPQKLNLWKEDSTCLEWLDKRSPNSVIYVNYGSLAILTPKQLEEFAWGLANSNHPFLWIIRSDLVEGKSEIITQEYLEEIKGRGLISSWCPQEKVLQHPSVAVFLTHCGWNSTLECISEGVPIICWPFFAEQQTNCLYACQEWKIGVEMEEGKVSREEVVELVKEIMESEKGKEVRENAMEWKKKAEKAIKIGGSSHNSFEFLVNYLKGNNTNF
ncbi:linamarin synthase 1-like [Amaranthus tricolor]|uniref:linamarin synthase 1-like n=1 Tax=Amaranthus tricolor TaxID=29722 RepID=UPI00258A592C|nr:linamarin synthase 1-like [Amaranthus tricolor]